MQCPNCLREVQPVGAGECPNCRTIIAMRIRIDPHAPPVRQPPHPPKGTRKEPGIVGVLNLVIPGAGELYAGRAVGGIVEIVIGFVLLGLALDGFGFGLYTGWAIGSAGWGFRAQRKINEAIAKYEFATTIQCPYCAERVKAEARVCRFCQRELPARAA